MPTAVVEMIATEAPPPAVRDPRPEREPGTERAPRTEREPRRQSQPQRESRPEPRRESGRTDGSAAFGSETPAFLLRRAPMAKATAED